MQLSYTTLSIIYILIYIMFLISSMLILVSYYLIPSFIEHMVLLTLFFFSFFFKLRVVLYFVVQWSALPSCLLGGLFVLRSIHWTILVNMLFSYPDLLCMSCFQYYITISVCPDIAVQSVAIFDYDYVFLNILKLSGYPFLGFMDYFYKL